VGKANEKFKGCPCAIPIEGTLLQTKKLPREYRVGTAMEITFVKHDKEE
jgi:hypothetical protein